MRWPTASATSGITNHYYLARELEDDPGYPVEIFWANQDDRGVHVNLSGAGVTRYADNPDLGPGSSSGSPPTGSTRSSPATTSTRPTRASLPTRSWPSHFPVDFRIDQVSAAAFGARNAEAITLMDEAGYA